LEFAMHVYDAKFYHLLASFAVRSAEAVMPVVRDIVPAASVADFGCGQGAWLSVWRKSGAAVTGVDGPYVDRDALLIDLSDFIAADLASPIDLGRRFDLVQSLEVAEHLPAALAGQFVETLVRHATHVMFSAAVPGQGGEHHVNEQPLDYWRAIFRRQGYLAVDCIRPRLAGNADVQLWYRCNILLYVAEAAADRLPEAARRCIVPDGTPLPNFWPLASRAQQTLVRLLPLSAVNAVARVKASLAARSTFSE
jgi:SAM-dependent methyltransferase